MVLALGPAAAEVSVTPPATALSASGPVAVILWLLGAAAVAAWVVIVIKSRQIARWSRAQKALEDSVGSRPTPHSADEAIHRHAEAPGAGVLAALGAEQGDAAFLEAVAQRAIVQTRARTGALMTLLATIGSASPFVGLLGTVWGILDAFLEIGRLQSASLPVVAPAIGEALLATGVGLAAAIPAVIGYNFLNRRLDGLMARLSATGRVWAKALAAE